MTSVSQEIVSGIKRFLGGFLGLARLEGQTLVTSIGHKTYLALATTLIFTLSAVWLSIGGVILLARTMPLEQAAGAMAGIFLVAGAVAVLVGRRQTLKSSMAATSQISSETEQREALVEQIQSANRDIVEASQDLKEAAVDALNPIPNVKDFVVKHPAATVLGGLALGLFVGSQTNQQHRRA